MTESAQVSKSANSEYDLDAEIEDHLRRILYIKNKEEPQKYKPYVPEFFGVLSLTDLRARDRKLWVIYHCKQPDLDKTIDEIHQKYGKKNMYDLFRTPVFSGPALRASVKKHFEEMKWFATGNLLEAPPKSHYNDERVVKAIADLHHLEQQKLYNYIMVKNNWWNRYS